MKFRVTPSDRRAIRWALNKRAPWSVDSQTSPLRLNPHSKTISSFKKRIKLFYLHKQLETCCYCKTILRGRNIESDREHVIPKSMMKTLSFHPFNIAISCKTCNMSVKSTNDFHIRNWRRIGRLLYKDISDPRNYNIVHPNIHDWYDHIDLHTMRYNAAVVHFYHPKTSRGRFTYKFFQLHNLEIQNNTDAQKKSQTNDRFNHPLIIAEALKHNQA